MLDIFFKNFFKKSEDTELKIIQSCPLFSKLSLKEVRFVQKILHKRHYTDGEIVFKPSSGGGMYIILKGVVNIFLGNPATQEESSVVSTLKNGDFFGELALLNNSSYQNMYAQASNNAQLLAFYQPDLNFLIDNHPKIGIRILKELSVILSYRLGKAEQKILQIHSEK